MMKYLILILFISVSCQTHSNSSASKSTLHFGNVNEMDEDHESALRIIKNLQEGIETALAESKNICIIFTGHAVINSKKLESEVILGNKEVYRLLKNNYVNIWLYVDERTSNLGKKWSELQEKEFNGSFQPQIFILDANGNKIDGGFGYTEAKTDFLPMLQKHSKE